MGAIASGGVVVINDDVVRGLGISQDVIQRVAEQEGRELLRREQAYRDGRPMPELAGKTVILVDDGLATGSSMLAAIVALREHQPGRIVVAVPAAPKSTCQELQAIVDEVVCATTPSPFLAVGASYWDFTQTTDEEVRDLLRAAATSIPARTTERAVSEIDVIRSAGIPTEEGVPSDEVLFDLVGDAHLVLLGEASHGTGDFYAARAAMTRRLIEEKGFCAVAVEADWPDALPGEPVRPGPQRRRRRRGGAARLPALPHVDVAQRRRPRLRRVAAGAQRPRRRRAAQGRLLRTRPLQPPPLHRRGHHLPRPGGSGGGPAGPGALRLLRPLRHRRRSDLRSGRRDGRRRTAASRRWSTSSSTCSATRWSTPAATGCSPRTRPSTPSRTPRS